MKHGKYILLTLAVGFALAVYSCGNHNPDSVFNPASKYYDSTAAADTSDTAQALRPYLSATCNAACANDSLKAHPLSSSVALSQGASSVAGQSSGLAGSSLVLQSSVSSSLASSSSAAPLVCGVDSILIQVVNGKVNNVSQLCAAVMFTYRISADSLAGQCFVKWNTMPSELQLMGQYNHEIDSVGVMGNGTTQVVTATFTACGTSVASSSATISSSSTPVATSSSAVVISSSSSVSLTVNYGTTSVLDGRDGTTYPSVKEDSLVWMTQNLSYLPAGSSAPCALISGNTITSSTDPAVCAVSGRYYNWAEAMSVVSTYNTATYAGTISQGICPDGWRLPTSTELRSVWSKISLDTTSVLQGGIFRSDVIQTGLYWTSDAYNVKSIDKDYCYVGTSTCGVAWVYHNTIDSTTAQQYNQGNTKTDAIPVRCVRSAN